MNNNNNNNNNNTYNYKYKRISNIYIYIYRYYAWGCRSVHESLAEYTVERARFEILTSMNRRRENMVGVNMVLAEYHQNTLK